jgi:hypothetical protein
MKTNTLVIRYLLLAWLVASLAGIMLIPFLSKESLAGLTSAFHSGQGFFFWGSLSVLAWYAVGSADYFSRLRYLLGRSNPLRCAKRFCSRLQVKAVEKRLSAHLEGALPKEIVRSIYVRCLLGELMRRLNRHLSDFNEDRKHPDIVYCRSCAEGLREFLREKPYE